MARATPPIQLAIFMFRSRGFDFTMVVSLAMIFLLFTSGIFWDVRELADPVLTDYVLLANPIAFIVDAYRQVLMEGLAPDLVHLFGLGVLAAVIVTGMIFLMRRLSQYLSLRDFTT